MKKSIVERLAFWIKSRESRLRSAGIKVDERLPKVNSNFVWKAGVGLEKDNIVVSFTVWERTIFQTELIVVDGDLRETLVSEDNTPKSLDEIDGILDLVVLKLIRGDYRHV